MNDLDHLLSRSAPPSATDGPALDAAIGALADESRAASTSPRRRLGKPWAVAAVVLGAVALAGGAAYGATVVSGGDGWASVTAAADSSATRFEWQTTLPDGTRCVERLTGFDLTADQIAIVEDVLAHPQRLLELDDGAVRDDFLASYDSSQAQQDIAGRDQWESWIDSGYGAVAAIDTEAGRGALTDDDLGVIPGGVENEVFLRSSMGIVTDGITVLGVDAMRHLNPETACEVGE